MGRENIERRQRRLEKKRAGGKFLEEGFKYLPLCARRPEGKNASH